MNPKINIGFIVNPYAGIGGPMALKGSDALDVDKAIEQGGVCRAAERAAIVLEGLLPYQQHIQWCCAPSIMGEALLNQYGFDAQVVGSLKIDQTSASDTEAFTQLLLEQNIDLLLFVGGDGTARNIVNALRSAQQEQQLVLGIPAGVKMHSGVYTVSPQATVRVLELFLRQEPVSTALQEVRDIDEALLREGKINTRYYGELRVPNDDRYVQQVKNTERQDESQLQLDIAASVVDNMQHDQLYIIGAGTTPKAVMDELSLPNTLLGIDVVLGRELIAADLTSIELEALLDQYPHHTANLLITAIAGQGHIIGRGNQQLSPSILRRVGKEQTQVLITPLKLAELSKRPLIMDSGDAVLDVQWSGWITVCTGYQQTAVYPLGCGG